MTRDTINALYEHFKHILENDLIGVFVFFNDKIVLINDKLTEIIGYTIEDLYGKETRDLMSLIHRDDVNTVVNRISEIYKTNKFKSGKSEFNFKFKDKVGIYKNIRVCSKRIPYDDGLVVLIMFVENTPITYIPDAFQILNNLNDNELEIFRFLIQNALDLIAKGFTLVDIEERALLLLQKINEIKLIRAITKEN